MKFRRRAGALLCALCMILSVTGFSASAAEETLFTESFDNDTVGAFPANEQIKLNVPSMTNGGYVKVVEENGRKYLDIEDRNTNVGEGIQINLPADKYPRDGKMTLTFDVYMKSATTAGFMVNARNEEGQNELSSTIEKYKIDQNISTSGTTESEKFITDADYHQRWRKVTFVLDLDRRTIDGYLDTEKLKTVSFRWGDQYAGTGITQIQFFGRGNVGETDLPKTISLDNIAVYNYEVLPEAEPSNVIFEDPFDTVGAIEESEILKLHKTLADGSSVMVAQEADRTYLDIVDMDPTSGDGIRLDIPEAQRKSSGKMTLAFDVKMDNATKPGFMINAGYTNFQNELSVNLEKDKLSQNISVPESSTMEIDKNIGYINNWKRITFILDLDARTVDTYIDSTKATTVPLRWGDQYKGESISNIQIIGRGNSNGFTTEELPKAIQIDNLVLYGKEVLPEGGQTPGETKILVDEHFDDMKKDTEPTRGKVQYNTDPSDMSENTYIHVVDRPEGETGDLALKIHDCTINNDNSRYVYSFEPRTEDITAEFDIRISPEGENAEGVLININDSNSQPAVALLWKEGRIVAFRGGYGSDIPYSETVLASGTAPVNKWASVKLEVSWQNRTFQMYLNGEKLGQPTSLRLDDIQNFGQFVLAGSTVQGTEEKNRTAYLDNLKIYTGEIEGGGEVEPPEPSGDLPIEEDFNDMTVGQEPTRGSAEYNTSSSQASENTTIHIVERPGGEAGDLALRISDHTRNNGNSRYRYDFPAQTGQLAIEFDIYIPTDAENSKGILINVNDEAGNAGVALFWEKGNIRAYRGGLGSSIPFEEVTVASGTAPTDTWTTMKLVMDYTTKSFQVFMDGQPVGGTIKTRLDSIENFAYFAIAGCTINESAEYSRTAIIDNLKIYQVEKSTVEAVTVTDASGNSLSSLTDVPEDLQSIDVKFHTNGINEETLTNETVVLETETGAVSAELTYDKETQILHIKPLVALERETTYTLKLTGIVDTNGYTMDEYITQIITRPLDFKAEVVFKNAAGTAINQLTPGETVTAEITLTNTTQQLITTTIIYTLYEGTCAQKILTKTVTVDANASETHTMEQVIPQGENLSAGVYFWDDLYQMGWQAQCQMIYQ